MWFGVETTTASSDSRAQHLGGVRVGRRPDPSAAPAAARKRPSSGSAIGHDGCPREGVDVAQVLLAHHAGADEAVADLVASAEVIGSIA